MIDLTSYSSLETALMVQWVIPGFETAYLTDYNGSLTYDGNTYTNIGNLLNIGGSTSDLKATPSNLTISLSGIPTGSVSSIISKQIKGSEVFIYRAFFDPATHDPIDLFPGVAGDNNTILKFKGIVTNYDISDSVDVNANLAVTTITLSCSSIVEVLSKKVSGRRTNPADFPGNSNMSRVRALANSNFNFGAR